MPAASWRPFQRSIVHRFCLYTQIATAPPNLFAEDNTVVLGRERRREKRATVMYADYALNAGIKIRGAFQESRPSLLQLTRCLQTCIPGNGHMFALLLLCQPITYSFISLLSSFTTVTLFRSCGGTQHNLPHQRSSQRDGCTTNKTKQARTRAPRSHGNDTATFNFYVGCTAVYIINV